MRGTNPFPTKQQKFAGDPEQTDRSGRQEALLCTLTNLLLVITWFISLAGLIQTPWREILMYLPVPALFLLFEEWSALRLPNLGGYLLLHALLFVFIVFLLPGMVHGGAAPGAAGLIALMLSLVITALGIAARLRGTRFFHPRWFLFLSGLTQFAIGYRLGQTLILCTGQVSIVITAFLCILWYNLSSIRGTLDAVHGKATVPYEQIRRGSRALVTGAVIIAAAVMIPVVLLASGETALRALMGALNAVRMLIVRLLRTLLGGGGENTAELQEMETAAAPDWTAAADVQRHPLLEAIFNALGYLTAIAVVAVLLFLIFRILRQFRKDFNRSGWSDGDRIEYLRPGEQKERMKKKSASVSGGLFRGRTPGTRIRRMYKRMIQTGAGAAQVKASHTPLEMENASLAPEGGRTQALERIHALYEKARYSRESCTGEDVSDMKKLTDAMKR